MAPLSKYSLLVLLLSSTLLALSNTSLERTSNIGEIYSLEELEISFSNLQKEVGIEKYGAGKSFDLSEDIA